MSRKGPTKNQYSQGLTYVAQTPSFLKNFGQPKSPSPPPPPQSSSSAAVSRSGREPLPERPREGKWARGSDTGSDVDVDARDTNGKEEEKEEEDEWGETYGGDEDGPQVVVLKEGRHLTAEELKRERRRGRSGPVLPFELLA